MSTILEVFTKPKDENCWLILDCGHWIKWTSYIHPQAGHELRCPECNLPKVSKP